MPANGDPPHRIGPAIPHAPVADTRPVPGSTSSPRSPPRRASYGQGRTECSVRSDGGALGGAAAEEVVKRRVKQLVLRHEGRGSAGAHLARGGRFCICGG